MKTSLQDPVLLFRAKTPAQAAMAQGILEPAGIPCFVDGPGVNDTGGNYALHTVLSAQAPLVYVPRVARGPSRELLEAAWGKLEGAPEVPLIGTERTTMLFLLACLVAMVGLVVWATR